MKRHDGFYWVRYKDHDITVGKYDSKSGEYPWTLIGSERLFTESEIVVIERIQVPEEILVAASV